MPSEKQIKRLRNICKSMAKAEAGLPHRQYSTTWTDVDHLLELGWIHYTGHMTFKLTDTGRSQMEAP